MLNLEGFVTGSLLYESANSMVYAGHRIADRREVVLKLVTGRHPHPKHVARLRREYQILGELASVEGVPRPLALMQDGHTPVLVVESTGGQSLMHLAVVRTFSLRDLVRMAARVAHVLAAIHERGVIHMDVTPGNIVWNNDTGHVELIDFGISTRLLHSEAEPLDPNVIRGTLAYMSPEQTGRMNRRIDARSDLYSLGATLYHVFAGRPPFQSADALELVHDHIAVTPTPLCDLSPGLPPLLGALIGRLLAKNAEERYPTAASLAADLDECVARLTPDGAIPPFPLAAHERGGKLEIRERLYGREEEVERLLSAFARAAAGGRELLVVSGHSGVGKTRLVGEICKPVTQRRGAFATGKYDQYRRNVPYSGIIDAFTQLVGRTLTLPAAELAQWRARLASAVGPNGQLIADVIPSVEHILGPQQPVPELPPIEARNRFLHAFDRFARAFADAAHPLVLFLDDLQWADVPSLQLIERLLTDAESGHLLVIGAYRPDQVDPLHPLLVKLEELGDTGVAITTIALAPLRVADVAELLADALGQPADTLGALAAACHAKTEGNPFFLSRLLPDLEAEGVLTWDRVDRRWVWDEGALVGGGTGAGAVEMLLRRLEQLPAVARHLLRLGALVGNRFDLPTLAIVSEREPVEIARALWPAMQQGMIVPLGQAWQLLEHAPDPRAAASEVVWRFLHDRVQQAAYGLIPVEQRPDLHLTMGRLLQEHLSPDEQQARLFEIVGHLHAARERLVGADDRAALARLLLAAGDRARSSAAYEPALARYQEGLEVLHPAVRKADADLALSLHLGAAEAAYSSADFDRMEPHVDAALARAERLEDRMRAVRARISARVAQNRPGDAIAVALKVLPSLGITLYPAETGEVPVPLDLDAWFARVARALAGRGLAALGELPPMTDPAHLAAMGILNAIASATYVAAPDLFPVVCLAQVALTAEHGITPHAAMAMATFGIMQGGVLGDLDACHTCALVAERLLQRCRADEVEGRTRYVSAVYLRVWKEPAERTWAACPEIHQRCMETGDVEFAAWAAMMRVIHAFFLGQPLGEAEPDAARWVAIIDRLHQRTAHGYASVSWQAMQNLAGSRPDFWVLSGPVYDEAERLPSHRAQGDRFAVCHLGLHKLLLTTLAQRVDEARAAADALRPDLGTMASLLHVPLFYLCDALNALTLLRAGDTDAVALLARVEKSQQELTLYAKHAPENHAHRVALVDAERAYSEGRDGEAAAHFERALALAHQHRWLLDEGLIAERAADFHHQRGNLTSAGAFAVEARYTWERLGARALLAALMRRYPEVSRQRDGAQMDIRAGRAFTSTTDHFDFGSVLKASQTISEEIRLDQLKRKLARIALENAGATHAVIVLGGEDDPRVEAVASLGDDADPASEPFATSPNLPRGIVLYTLRTGQALVLAEATSDTRFSEDPYVLRVRPRAVLCAPLMRQGRVIGAFYLENREVAGAFTRDRIEALTVLAGQAAISIENAELVESLEQKVDERTRSLRAEKERTEQALAEAEVLRRRAEEASRAKSTFLANMSHELRTPLNAVLGFAQLMARRRGRDPEDLQQLAIIGRAGEHLLGLIDDVLSLAKIEAGQLTLTPTPFSLVPMLKGLTDMLRVRAEGKGVDLVLERQGPLPAQVVGDERRLRQVLLNLLGNAVKFTEQGTVVLRASWHEGRARFDVEDPGPGLTPAEVARLFQPFVQTATGEKAKEGTGLGLTISRSFAQLMGGDISVVSEPGRGSTFTATVALPAASAGEAGRARGDRRRVMGLAAGQPPVRSLVVDDVLENRLLLSKLLQAVGIEVREAADGEQAIAVWRAFQPHLIFMDLRMRVMDGRTATEQIRAAEAAAGHGRVRIVVLSASALERETAAEWGSDAFLAKPFREEAVFGTVAEQLGIRFVHAEEEVEGAAHALTAARLAALPDALRKDLAEALGMGDDEGAKAAAEVIRAHDAPLAEALKQALDQCHLDELLRLLEQGAPGRPPGVGEGRAP